jgi:peptide/nickel transport system substrate-binding protein
MLIEAMPQNLDPRIGTDAQSQHLDGLIFNSLIALNGRMEIVPDLAERWETPDALTYIFHLHSGVRFHNGKPLTSSDVKFTFDSILNGHLTTPKRAALRPIQSVEAPDAATVIVHLRESYASFLWSIASPAIGIVPESSGAEIAAHPVGTGPFRFVSAVTDEEIVLERNDDYFRQHANVKQIRFRIVPDTITRALEMQKGSADLTLNGLTADMTEALRHDAGLAVTDQPGTSLAYLVINCDDPILRHREVRQALAYGTDRDSLIHYLLRGQARPAYGLLPPDHWAYETNVQPYRYDTSRAGELLDTAGFPRGADGIRFHLTLKTSTDEVARLLGAALQEEWRTIGVALELRPLEFSTFYADITRGSFSLAYLKWIGANNDPDIYDFVFNSRRIPPDGANRGHYRNGEVDALLIAERVETDQAKRREILSQLQKLIAQDAPYLTLWFTDNVCVHRQRIQDVNIAPDGNYDFLMTISAR